MKNVCKNTLNRLSDYMVDEQSKVKRKINKVKNVDFFIEFLFAFGI